MSGKSSKHRPVTLKYRDVKLETYEGDDWSKQFLEKCRRDDLMRYTCSVTLTLLIVIAILFFNADLKFGFLPAIPLVKDLAVWIRGLKKD